MTREDIIRMAREAGIKGVSVGWNAWTVDLERFFQAAYAAGAADEREECAKVCEELDLYSSYECASAIRARGKM